MNHTDNNPFALPTARQFEFNRQVSDYREFNDGYLSRDEVDDEVAALQDRQLWAVAAFNPDFAFTDLLYNAVEDYAEKEAGEGEDETKAPPGLHILIYAEPLPKVKFPWPKPDGELEPLPILTSYNEVGRRVKEWAAKRGIVVKSVKLTDHNCTESWARRDTRGYAPFVGKVIITPEKALTKGGK